MREYAAPYSLLVSKYDLHSIYIDGFAGPGEHVSRTTGEPVPGSPLNALRTNPPFHEYHFIDTEPRRAEQLRKLSEGRPNVFVYTGDCNDILLNQVFPRVRYENRRRALCLLDPYNINLEWKVVETAGRMGTIEIFLNFMVMDMNMNVLLRDPDKADTVQIRRMDRFWGDQSWREVAYIEDPQGQLFREPGKVKVEDANEKIAQRYRRRLMDAAGFGYVPRPLRFVNTLGATIYYLLFASPNRTGNKIVLDIFEKYRKLQAL